MSMSPIGLYLHAYFPVDELFGKSKRYGLTGRDVLLGIGFSEVSRAHTIA